MPFVCAECGKTQARAGYCASEGAPLVETDDPLLGTEVGRYRLATLLGQGGMGRVYRAVQPTIGSRVAIKILSERCAADPALVERFFAEARAVNLIKHESIASVLDLATLPDGRPYIVMEYIDGRTLGELVRRGRAPLGGIAQLFDELLSALEAAHAIGIIHRDLKPDNVLVTEEGHAKVLDFGIAKLAPNLGGTGHTATGALLGTPAYMSPEQIAGAAGVDPRSDLYAAGVVLFEAVTGRAPFRGDSIYDLMRGHLEEAPPSPRSLRADLPVTFEQVILTALAKDPADRFQSAAAMADALDQAAAELAPGEWRALSVKGSAIPMRGSMPRIRPSGPLIGSQRIRSHLIPSSAVRQSDSHGATARSHVQQARIQPSPPDMNVAAELKTGRIRSDLIPSDLIPPRRRAIFFVAGGTALLVIGVIVGVSLASRDSTSRRAVEPVSTDVGSAAVASTDAAEPPTSTTSAQLERPAPLGGRERRPGKASPAAASGEREVAAPGSVKAEGVHFIERDKTTIHEPVDFDPAAFDPVAYLPKARALARRIFDDAQLTAFDVQWSRPDGRADLTRPKAEADYQFRSPSRSKRPAGSQADEDLLCAVHVEVKHDGAAAWPVTRSACTDRIVRDPPCSLATIWKQARNMKITVDLAQISWLFDENFYFNGDLEKGGSTNTGTIPCP